MIDALFTIAYFVFRVCVLGVFAVVLFVFATVSITSAVVVALGFIVFLWSLTRSY